MTAKWSTQVNIVFRKQSIFRLRSLLCFTEYLFRTIFTSTLNNSCLVIGKKNKSVFSHYKYSSLVVLTSKGSELQVVFLWWNKLKENKLSYGQPFANLNTEGLLRFDTAGLLWFPVQNLVSVPFLSCVSSIWKVINCGFRWKNRVLIWSQ